MTFRSPGPLTFEVTVMNQTLPKVPINYQSSKEFSKTNACLLVKIERFHHMPSRKTMITKTWSRLRVLDPTLKPWGLDETIVTNDPQVLDENHILGREYFGAFWSRDYMTSTESMHSSEFWEVQCRIHNRMECFRVESQLGMQPESGLHDMHA